MRPATAKTNGSPTAERVEPYRKPELIRYGTFRELTRIGFGPDGDGGLFGLGIADGCFIGCDPVPTRS